MAYDSDLESNQSNQTVPAHDTPSAEATAGNYPADEEQRQAILESIPLRDGVDPHHLMTKLTESAGFASRCHEKQQAMPSAKQLAKAFDPLKKDYEALPIYQKHALDAILGIKLDQAIDEILHIDNRPDQMRERGGRKSNEAAHIFILHSAGIWGRYSTSRPPKSVNVNSPFYKFICAALPRDVLDSRCYRDLTSSVNRALRQFYRNHPFAPHRLL